MRGAVPDFSLEVANLLGLEFSGVAAVLAATSQVTPNQEQSDSASFGVWGEAAVGSSTLPIAIDVGFGTSLSSIGLVPGASVTFGQLAGVFPALPVLSVVPDALKSVNGLEIDLFAVQLTPDRSSFRRLSVVIASTPGASLDWTIIPGVLVLRAVTLTLTVVADSSGNLSYSGSLQAGLTLGSLVISVSVYLPIGTTPWTITAYPDVALPDLGDLASLLGGQSLASMLPAQLGAIGGFTLGSLQATIDPATVSVLSVGFGLSSTSSWPIIPGRLAISDVVIDLTIGTPLSSPQLSGQIGGDLVLGSPPNSLTLTLVVERDDPQSDWMFTVNVTDAILPSLDDLANLAGIDSLARCCRRRSPRRTSSSTTSRSMSTSRPRRSRRSR